MIVLGISSTSYLLASTDAFALFYNAQEKKVYGLNGSGRAPSNLSISHIRARGIEGDSIPLTDLNSVTVPGSSYHFYWSAPS